MRTKLSTSQSIRQSVVGFLLLPTVLIGILVVFLTARWNLAGFFTVGALVAVGSLALIIRWPRLGVYLSIFVAPIQVGLIQIAGYGMYIFQPVVLVATGAMLVRSLLTTGRVLAPRKMWPVIGLWFTYVLSVGSAIDLNTTLGGIIYFIPIMAVCWAMACEGRNIQSYQALQRAVIWPGVFFALVGLVQLGLYHMGVLLSFGPRHSNFLQLYSRPSGLQYEPVWFGIYTATILTMSIPFLARSKGDFRHRGVGLAVVLILTFAVLVSGTRSAWVGVLVALSIYLLMVWKLLLRKAGWMLGVGGLLAAVLLVAAGIWPQFLEPATRLKFLLDPTEQNSVVRLNTWRFAWEYIRLRPIQGYGLSAWEIIAPQVEESTGLTIIGGKSVPNIFLENWLSAGLPGLVLTAVFCVYYVFQLWRAWRKADSHARVGLESVFLGLVAVLTASFFTNAFKHNWFWVVTGLGTAALYAFGKSARSYPGGNVENPAI